MEKKSDMKIHIHKVAQLHKCSYEKIYKRYGKHIDHKKMISLSILKDTNI